MAIRQLERAFRIIGRLSFPYLPNAVSFSVNLIFLALEVPDNSHRCTRIYRHGCRLCFCWRLWRCGAGRASASLKSVSVTRRSATTLESPAFRKISDRLPTLVASEIFCA